MENEESYKEIERLRDALENIFLNTINKKEIDNVYKSGILWNIEMAIGKEEFERWKKLYSIIL